MSTQTSMTPLEPSRFEQDTAVRRISDDRWQGEVAPGWGVMGVPNGGYVMAMAGRVLSQALPHPDPLTITGYYLEPTEPGPVILSFASLRHGRSVSTGAVRLLQGGRERARFLATHGDLSRQHGPNFIADAAPAIPRARDCVTAPVGLEIYDRLEVRLPLDRLGWMHDETAEHAEIAGWVKFRDAGEPDSLSLLLFADAFPPAVFARFGPTGWVPTLELNVHLRARPAPGFVLGRFRTRYLIDGQLEEDGELWDSRGRLVALSRQLARLRLE